MMHAIVGWSLRFHLLVLGIAAATMLIGFTQLPRMPVDVLPEFTPPRVEVQTEALGLSAEEVEQLITVPLEADLLHGVAWLDKIESESVPGLSSIVLTFQPGTNEIRARQMVAERLTQAFALPNVSTPAAMLQPLSSTSRVMMIGFSSQTVSLIDMSVLARWTIRPRLMSVPGVANVTIWGQRERQLQVLVDPEQLADQGVPLQRVIETTGNALWVSSLTFLDASTPGTGGFIETPQQRINIQHISPIRTAEDLANVVLEPESASDISRLRLSDVAQVVEDHQPLIGDALVNNGPGLLLVVEKFPGANTLEVTRGLEQALDALRPGLAGIEIDSSIFRPATYIETATGNLSLALILGLVLLVVALGALLVDWRAALIGLVTIPLSLAVAALVLSLLGSTINAMVAAGLVLAIGIVVDDAVIGTDSVLRRLREPHQEDGDRSRGAIILEATVEGRSAIVYATLIVVLAGLPLLFIGGSAAAFVPSVALAFGLAVLASMIVALTVTPALALLVRFRGTMARREFPLAARVRRGYEAVLSRVVKRTRAVFVTVAVVTVAGIGLFGAAVAPQVGQSLLPAFKESGLLIHWDGAPGTSRIEMDRIVARASNELRSIPGIRDVGAHVGRAIMSDQVVGINSAEIWVTLDPAADYAATLASIQDVADGYPGLSRSVVTYANERVGHVLTGPGNDVVVRVYGQDLDVLRGKAEEVRQALSGVSGLVDANVEPTVTEPTINIHVDLAAADRYGIKPGDVRREATTLLSGIRVGSLFEDQKVFEVVVWGTPAVRQNVETVRGLVLDTPSGGHMRLGDVAEVSVGAAPSVIKREGVFRRLDVGANVRGRDVDAVMRDMETALAGIDYPLEYRAEIVVAPTAQQANLVRLLGVVAAAAIMIFLLLQAALGSWRRAFVVVLALPSALVGGVLAALIGGGIFSIGSIVGFFTVLAIAARNGILLFGRYQRLERSEGGAFGIEVIVRGARERMAPTLTTAIATALAVAPFVLLGDLPGYEIVRPMAIVILGGLVTSTLLNLFVVPAVYLRSGPSPEPDAASQLFEQPGLTVA